MTACFADTFFFLALLNRDDREYQEKARSENRVDRPIVTSEWVLMELADHLCDTRNRHLFGQVLDAIRGDHRFEIVPAETELFAEAVTLYRARRDQDWSLTDCTSFVLMNQRGLLEVLTADHHFEQAGFIALLK
jgi:predicted nucleic acid-binding protein